MKYYVLLLNNCYDKDNHYLERNLFSVIPNVLKKELTDLSNIEEEFLGLDDTITIGKNSWIVKGSFPVFAVEADGKLFDIITFNEIKYSKDGKDTKGLTYKNKFELQDTGIKMMQMMLEILDEEAIERYIKGLNKIERNLLDNSKSKNYMLVPNDNGLYTPLLLAQEIDDQLIDTITGEKIYPASENIVTRRLNYTQKTRINDSTTKTLAIINKSQTEEYTKSVEKARLNSIRRYNDYISMNKEKEFDTKIELTKKNKVRIKKVD